MRAYSNALKAGVLGLAMLTAAPAFSDSAQAEPTNAAITSAPDLKSMLADPVHKTAAELSSNKLVLVLGGGFHRLNVMATKRSLTKLGMIEGKHFEVLQSGDPDQKHAVIYVGSKLVTLPPENEVFIFTDRETDIAISLIRRSLETGSITLAASLTP